MRGGLDTNVVLRYLLADHDDHSARATELFREIESGQRTVVVTMSVVFTLERSYKVPKPGIRDALVPLLNHPGVLVVAQPEIQTIFDLYVGLNLPFADAAHAVAARRHADSVVFSFDRDFDRIPGITRIEP